MYLLDTLQYFPFVMKNRGTFGWKKCMLYTEVYGNNKKKKKKKKKKKIKKTSQKNANRHTYIFNASYVPSRHYELGG